MLSQSQIADIFHELELETEEQRACFRFAWPSETPGSISVPPIEPVPETRLGDATEPAASHHAG